MKKFKCDLKIWEKFVCSAIPMIVLCVSVFQKDSFIYAASNSMNSLDGTCY